MEWIVHIDSDLCSNCGICAEQAPGVIQLDANKLAEVHLGGKRQQLAMGETITGRVITKEELPAVVAAAEVCPGENIFIEIGRLTSGGLVISEPVRSPSATTVPPNNMAALLPVELLAGHGAALESLSRQRQLPGEY